MLNSLFFNLFLLVFQNFAVLPELLLCLPEMRRLGLRTPTKYYQLTTLLLLGSGATECLY